MNANTLFLRLEGPLQSFGDQQSKFVVRRTTEAPTKSALIGMLCAALGVSRVQAADEWLPQLNDLRMAVRIDRPGIRWWDYHTVGAGMQMRTAQGGSKPGAMLTRREYLCDASFLVALQGGPDLISRLREAIEDPKWVLFLGRKCCPPSRPLMEHPPGDFPDLVCALKSIPWQRRLRHDDVPEAVHCLLDWTATPEEPEAPPDAMVWYDVPVSFEPPAHQPRFVIRKALRLGEDGELTVADAPSQRYTPRPPRPRAGYHTTEYKEARKKRLAADVHLCVFCKSPAATVQHITYRGDESPERLRSLCRLCHDAVTMIEYGLGMGMDRINPEEPSWRDVIIQKREEIIKFRSLETRRRHLTAEEVE